jgi:hypothetical protein
VRSKRAVAQVLFYGTPAARLAADFADKAHLAYAKEAAAVQFLAVVSHSDDDEESTSSLENPQLPPLAVAAAAAESSFMRIAYEELGLDLPSSTGVPSLGVRPYRPTQ